MSGKQKQLFKTKIVPGKPGTGNLFEEEYVVDDGPVECMGMIFENDEKRREYFLEKLREKLKDPKFRKIEGFPIGEDEDILALSDPPNYTTCPNPFIEDFINHYGKPYDPETDDYRREPFASDTGSGKTHPIYTAHSYHSKISHLATVPCILHYTDSGDIVLDGFSGSGMTGVAAQLCGEPESNFRAKLEQKWKDAGYAAPKWGVRRPILIDLSPVANFIAYNLNLDVSARDFKKAAEDFFKKIDAEIGWMYKTLHSDGKRKGRINYVVWSEVFTCPNCAGDVVFMDQAYNPETGKFANEFSCPNCRSTLTTRSCEHKFTIQFDKAIGETVRKVTYVPVEIEYILPGDKTRWRKKPDEHDLALMNKLADSIPVDRFPSQAIPKDIYHYSRFAPKGVTHFHHLHIPRALHALSIMWRIAGEWPDVRMRGFVKFMVEQVFWTFSMLNRYRPTGYSMTNQFLTGVYYVPVAISELSPWNVLQEAIGAAGFVVADVRMMERGSGSYRQVTAGTAVKADVIISTYKPNGGPEERFKLTAGTERYK